MRFTYTYDDAGRRTLMADNSGRYTTTYDGRGMVQAVTGPPDKQIQYTYDALGRRSVMVDPDSGRTTYTYDGGGRLDHLVNPQAGRTTYTYDALGRATQMELANGTQATYTYDAAGRLAGLRNAKSDNSAISGFDYAYDAAGNRTHVVESDGTRVTWTYDDTYQLIREERGGGDPYDNTHEYDSVGNRLVKIDTGGNRTTFAYDDANQLSTSENAAGTTNYTYDEAGNLALTVDAFGGRATNTWDGMNRRTLVNDQTPMVYNADGLRVSKGSGANLTNFIWDDQNYLMETDENDATQMVYTNRPDVYGKLISQRRNTGGGSWSIVYYHFDGLGSTANISDINEYVPETYIYDAFGNVISSNSFIPNFLWVGQLGYYWDWELADYYIRARHYNPAIARWLSMDPIGYWGGTNLYRYVDNQAVSLLDPSGLIAIPVPEEMDMACLAECIFWRIRLAGGYCLFVCSVCADTLGAIWQACVACAGGCGTIFGACFVGCSKVYCWEKVRIVEKTKDLCLPLIRKENERSAPLEGCCKFDCIYSGMSHTGRWECAGYTSGDVTNTFCIDPTNPFRRIRCPKSTCFRCELVRYEWKRVPC